MRKLVGIAATCLGLGCLDATSPADAVLVTGSTSVTSIRAEQTVSIALTIYNRGEDDIQLALQECVPPFEVLNDRGQVVGPGSRACSLELVAPVIVPARGSTRYTTSWAGDSSGSSHWGALKYLSPGQYSIRPRVPLVSDDGHFVYGPLLPVTITP